MLYLSSLLFFLKFIGCILSTIKLRINRCVTWSFSAKNDYIDFYAHAFTLTTACVRGMEGRKGGIGQRVQEIRVWFDQYGHPIDLSVRSHRQMNHAKLLFFLYYYYMDRGKCFARNLEINFICSSYIQSGPSKTKQTCFLAFDFTCLKNARTDQLYLQGGHVNWLFPFT